MKHVFLDGFEFVAEDATEVCTVLWHSMKFNLHPSLQSWMEANAKIMKGVQGAALRTDSPEHHVDDMLAAGVLKTL